MPNKITAPIARSTAYDFNCKLARCHQTDRHAAGNLFADTVTDEDRHVMPHEVLFQIHNNKPSTRMQAMSSLNGVPNNTELAKKLDDSANLFSPVTNVFSNQIFTKSNAQVMLNTWKEYNNSTDADERKHARRANVLLNNLFRYVGVAITGCQAGAVGALQRQGFSATRGGLMTIVNTSKETIYPGSQIQMQFDWGDILQVRIDGRRETSIDGIPRNKLIPRIVAESDSVIEDIDESAEAIFNLKWLGSFAPDPILLRRLDFEAS